MKTVIAQGMMTVPCIHGPITWPECTSVGHHWYVGTDPTSFELSPDGLTIRDAEWLTDTPHKGASVLDRIPVFARWGTLRKNLGALSGLEVLFTTMEPDDWDDLWATASRSVPTSPLGQPYSLSLADSLDFSVLRKQVESWTLDPKVRYTVGGQSITLYEYFQTLRSMGPRELENTCIQLLLGDAGARGEGLVYCRKVADSSRSYIDVGGAAATLVSVPSMVGGRVLSLDSRQGSVAAGGVEWVITFTVSVPAEEHQVGTSKVGISGVGLYSGSPDSAFADFSESWSSRVLLHDPFSCTAPQSALSAPQTVSTLASLGMYVATSSESYVAAHHALRRDTLVIGSEVDDDEGSGVPDSVSDGSDRATSLVVAASLGAAASYLYLNKRK
jgi:hypothetical protein